MRQVRVESVELEAGVYFGEAGVKAEIEVEVESRFSSSRDWTSLSVKCYQINDGSSLTE